MALSSSIPPHLIPSRNTITTLLIATAAATPIIYLYAIRRSSLKHIQTHDHASSSTHPHPIVLPTSLPDSVRLALTNKDGEQAESTEEEVILSYERLLSHPIPATLLLPSLPIEEEGLDVVLTPYVRATMTAWLSTHGGKAVRNEIVALSKTYPNSDNEVAQLVASMEPEAIANLDFQEGDVVNGIYRVSHRGESVDGGERVELTLTPPPDPSSPTDPGSEKVVDGIVVAGWEVLAPEPGAEDEEEGGVNLVFVNETWLWRRKSQGRTMLEWSLGRWWHSAMAGWLVGKGIEAVTVSSRPSVASVAATVEKKELPGAASPLMGDKQKQRRSLQEVESDAETETEGETETEPETSATSGSDYDDDDDDE